MANIKAVAQAEPVTVAGAINAALASTWGVVVIVAELEPAVAGGVTAAIGAWVLVGSLITRKFTTPAQ